MVISIVPKINPGGTMPVGPLPKQAACRQLERYLYTCSRGPRYQNGGVVEFGAVPSSTAIDYVGDLHTRIDNLNRFLNTGSNYDQLRSGRLILNVLGDAVHPESGGMEMTSSVVMMQQIMDLKIQYPDNFFYYAGNHDSFSTKAVKHGTFPGLLMRFCLEDLYGADYATRFEDLLAALPIVSVANGVIATHGGPIRPPFTIRQLEGSSPANEDDPIIKQAIWGRFECSEQPKLSYDMEDVHDFLSAMGQQEATLLVAHTKPGHGRWHREIAPNHHVIFGALDNFGYARLQYGKLNFMEVSGASPATVGRLPIEFFTQRALPERPKRPEDEIVATNADLFRNGGLHDRSTFDETIVSIGGTSEVETFAYAEQDGTLVAFGDERHLSNDVTEMMRQGLLFKLELSETVNNKEPGKPRFSCTLPSNMPENTQKIILRTIERANRACIAEYNSEAIIGHMKKHPGSARFTEIPMIIDKNGAVVSITDVDGFTEGTLYRMERGELMFIKLSLSRRRFWGRICYELPARYSSLLDGDAYAVAKMTAEVLNKV